MASSTSIHCSVSLPSLPKLTNFKTNNFFSFNPTNPNSILSSSLSTIRSSASSSFSSTAFEDTAMSIDNLRRFFNINIGKWNGSFYQFDAGGKLLQRVSTKLSVSSYGEGELMSLIQSESLFKQNGLNISDYKVAMSNHGNLRKVFSPSPNC